MNVSILQDSLQLGAVCGSRSESIWLQRKPYLPTALRRQHWKFYKLITTYMQRFVSCQKATVFPVLLLVRFDRKTFQRQRNRKFNCSLKWEVFCSRSVPPTEPVCKKWLQLVVWNQNTPGFLPTELLEWRIVLPYHRGNTVISTGQNVIVPAQYLLTSSSIISPFLSVLRLLANSVSSSLLPCKYLTLVLKTTKLSINQVLSNCKTSVELRNP